MVLLNPMRMVSFRCSPSSPVTTEGMLPIAPQYSLPLTNPLNRRATHLHLIAHIGGSISSAGTYSGGTIPHIGQVFFEQSLISEVEATSPYNTNTVAITLNSVDRVFTEQASVTAGYSDVVTIKKLGSALSDGLLGAISIGLDLTANKSTGSGSGTGTGTGTGTGGAPTGGMGGPPS